jgi:uncharacterized protein
MMSTDKNYRTAIVNYVREQARPIEKFSHQPRLFALARQVGDGQTYDDDVLFAAAWMHDLGVFIGHRPEDPDQLARWDNVAYAIERAPVELTRLGFPVEKIPAVVEAIRCHQPSANPSNIEGIILRDADILEQLGAIGILRTVCKVGRDTRFSTFAPAVQSLRRSLTELPQQLRLDTARVLAASKILVLEAFLQGVERESYGALALEEFTDQKVPG